MDLIDLENKVINGLNRYLGFDCNRLFAGDLVSIFGGSIRDIICDMEINDIDILVGSKSIKYINSLLISENWVYNEYLTPKDLSSIYSNIHVINEPHTWIKDGKIIQLIRPAINGDEEFYKKSYLDLISNVDISCCGISYSVRGLEEHYKNAILHAQNKVFYVNEYAKMYCSRRIIHRIGKLEDRGWVQIMENTQSINRDLKIGLIL